MHLFVDEHLGCSHIFAIVNHAVNNIEVQTSFQTSIFFFRYIPRSGIVGSYVGCHEPIPLLGIYLKQEMLVWKDVCTSMLLTAWFTIAKVWKEPNQQINGFKKMWCNWGNQNWKRHMYPPMFIAALFTISRTWKQPRCPSTEEWIRKLWYYTQRNITQLLKRTHLIQFYWDRWNWSLLYRVK